MSSPDDAAQTGAPNAVFDTEGHRADPWVLGPASGGAMFEPVDATTETVDGPSLAAALEAVLLVADEPVSVAALGQLTQASPSEVTRCLQDLADGYVVAGRGFELREIAGGWRFYTAGSCGLLVERFLRDGQQARLTQAALETLAVVAYRQPVSRGRVSAIRGVNCDGVMRTLVTRGLVDEAGSDETSGATLYRTTTYFLERLGLRDLQGLPPIAPYLPDLDTLDLSVT